MLYKWSWRKIRPHELFQKKILNEHTASCVDNSVAIATDFTNDS